MKKVVQKKPIKKQFLANYLGFVILITIFASVAKAMFSYQGSIEQKYGTEEVSPIPVLKPTSAPTAVPTTKPTFDEKITQPTATSKPLQPITCTSAKCGNFAPENGKCSDYVCCSLPDQTNKPMLKAECDTLVVEELKARNEQQQKATDALLAAQKQELDAQIKVLTDRINTDEKQKIAQDTLSSIELEKIKVENENAYLNCNAEVHKWNEDQQKVIVQQTIQDVALKANIQKYYFIYLERCSTTFKPRLTDM